MWGFIGIFVLCCGIYALYSFVIMKVKGEINASILLGKDYTYKKCKDKEAYIAKTAPALFVFGLVSVIYGVIDVIHCYVHTMTIVDTVAMIIFLIVLIWFGVYTINLRNRYYKCQFRFFLLTEIKIHIFTVVKMMWMEYNSNRLRKKKNLKCARTLIF